MLDQLETLILNTLQTLFDQFGWLGVFALMTFENATGITPSEIILTFAGWMLIEAHNLHPATILLGGLYAALGSALGSSLIYWVARLGGRPLVDRLARVFRINPALINASEAQFQRWGSGLVLIGRVIPGVRTLVSIPAGLGRMSYPVFFTATFIGTYIWCTLLIGAGYLLGHEWRLVSGFVKQYLPLIFAGGLLAIAIFISSQSRVQPALSMVRIDKE